jgi:hypothetical protein
VSYPDALTIQSEKRRKEKTKVRSPAPFRGGSDKAIVSADGLRMQKGHNRSSNVLCHPNHDDWQNNCLLIAYRAG